MKKVLVFGGSGFLGSYVCEELISRGYEVHIADINDPEAEIRKDIIYHNCDIRDVQALEKIVGKEIFAVYNFAGMADIDDCMENRLQAIELNVTGNAKLLEACVKVGVKRYIYASSAYVFSNKSGIYGLTKLMSEKLVEEYGRKFDLDYTVLRYGSLYGSRANHQNALYRMIVDALNKGEIAHPGSGDEQREYIHGRDAARLSVDILSEEHKNKRYMLTGVERYRYRDLLTLIREIFDNRIEIRYLCDDRRDGHYSITPYVFQPASGEKLVANPFVDLGQGLLEMIAQIRLKMDKENA